ncbi:MAG: (2Fe-2S)-binding protein, partial [Rhodospirillales bacterium]|nr:(2Fe-2S)-binding protein [Rhodospirillales bacterium]
FWTMPPISPLDNNILARAYVPMDDENTMMVYWMHNEAQLPGRNDGRKEIVGGGDWNFLPNTTDWMGRYRLSDNVGNDYNIDREVQRTQSYSGITGINLQDQAMGESMGRIVDRTIERLAPSDIMITQTRKHIIRAAKAYQKDGTLPQSATDASVYRGVRGGQFVAPEAENWLNAYDTRLENAPLKPPVAKAAE